MNKYNIKNVKTFEYTKIIGIENIEFGNYVIIDDFVLIYAKEKIKFGDHVHISSFSSITGGGELEIESFSGMASGCRIITGSDDFKTHGIGGPTVAEEFRNMRIGKIKLEQFSILGSNCVVLPNVTIGEGATVAANSVITKNLEPWGIYIGNRKVGQRDKKAVLENYKIFLEKKELDRIGNIFK